MSVLIVGEIRALCEIWARHLRRQGRSVLVADGQESAVSHLATAAVRVVVIDLMLSRGSALAVADYAAYRRPEARIVFVTGRRFFTDGSVFALSPNAAAVVGRDTPPADLAAIVDYHGSAA